MSNVWYLDDIMRYSVVAEEKGLTVRQHHLTKGPVEEAPIFTEVFLPYPVELHDNDYGRFSLSPLNRHEIVRNLDDVQKAFSSDCSREGYIWNLGWWHIEESEFEFEEEQNL